ncbi:hypothetical protein LJY25_18915 [Hymenobacter sp. BT175]|uniref:hypothetical protein n=1 Tax=Hymenobacter translucens TaxID=2886507 RepID=UPI001D0F4228|nr:hypothetical protein [Hymenobacter translucens]MCC2548527.1 hypothetical protein [Hymenobacter translucens]
MQLTLPYVAKSKAYISLLTVVAMIPADDKPLNAIFLPEALELLTQYAGSDATWWMEPRVELRRRNLKTDLVIARLGQTLVRRTLMSTAYPGLIRCLNRQTQQPLPLPHAPEVEYENEERLAPLRKQGLQLRRQLPPLLNKMLRRQYLLEDAGLTTAEARDWCTRSEQIDKAANWEALRDMLNAVGPPSYTCHSSQLAPLVASAAAAYPQIQALLAGPYPGPANADRLDGAPNDYRRWYGPYASSAVQFGWDPDNSPGLPDDYEEPEEGEEASLSEEAPPAELYVSRDDIREELVEMRQQIDRLLARL